MSFAHTFLMCSPKYFEVTYVINHWMALHQGICTERALQQWQRLYQLIGERAHVKLVEPQPGLPDMVFTANAALMFDNKVMVSRFLHPQRTGEERHFQNWFSENQFQIHKTPSGVNFEGAGDALLDRNETLLWMGWGYRSARTAQAHLSEYFDLEVVPLRLVDERFYHLDTCFCPLSRGYLMYYPGAFDDQARREIAERVPRSKRIAVSERDAVTFACNAVNIDDVVIVNRISSELRAELEAAGFEVIQTDLSEFLKAGGGSKCLTLRLDEPRFPALATMESAFARSVHSLSS